MFFVHTYDDEILSLGRCTHIYTIYFGNLIKVKKGILKAIIKQNESEDSNSDNFDVI